MNDWVIVAGRPAAGKSAFRRFNFQPGAMLGSRQGLPYLSEHKGRGERVAAGFGWLVVGFYSRLTRFFFGLVGGGCVGNNNRPGHRLGRLLSISPVIFK